MHKPFTFGRFRPKPKALVKHSPIQCRLEIIDGQNVLVKTYKPGVSGFGKDVLNRVARRSIETWKNP